MIRSRLPIVALTGAALAVSSLGEANADPTPAPDNSVPAAVARTSIARLDQAETTFSTLQQRSMTLRQAKDRLSASVLADDVSSDGEIATDSPDHGFFSLVEPGGVIPATLTAPSEAAAASAVLSRFEIGQPAWPALKTKVLDLVAEAEAAGEDGSTELRQLSTAIEERETEVVAALEELEISVEDLSAEVEELAAKVAVDKARATFAEHLATATQEGRFVAAAKAFRDEGKFVPEQMVCPIDGPHEFIDSWGFARSGGRRHKGVDMMASPGTPLAAPVSGDVVHRTTGLGGLSYFLYGDDGNTYYGTHLQRYGKGGRVDIGEIIGYVGSSGNARGIPHLHFEIWPSGGKAVNPYPATRSACG